MRIITNCWRGICVRDDCRILAEHWISSDPKSPNYWDLPGERLIGRLQDFDPVSELGKIGITVSDLRHRTIVDTAEKNNFFHRRITVYAFTKYVEGIPLHKPVSKYNCAEIRWMTVHELLDKNLAPGVADAAETLLCHLAE